MKIIINEKNAIVDSTWQEFIKVRAVIKNNKDEYAITQEAGKIIFPGGKCEPNEKPTTAIKRELQEELGIDFKDNELKQILEIETFYEDYYDFRTDSIVPRHTKTIYFLINTEKQINIKKQHLTQDEIRQQFKIFFVDKNTLINLLQTDHSSVHNGQYFDQENQIILNEIIITEILFDNRHLY